MMVMKIEIDIAYMKKIPLLYECFLLKMSHGSGSIGRGQAPSF